VASVTRHAVRMRRIILSVDCLAVSYFSTLSNKWYDFHKNVIGPKMWVLVFSKNLSETFKILSTIEGGIIVNVHRYSCKVTLILVRF
jgi:hypothetical protein